MADFSEQAEQIVDLIRSQNWKNGGVLSFDRPEAISVVEQAMRAAYTQGIAEAAQSTGERMLRAFDAVVGGPQTEAVKEIR